MLSPNSTPNPFRDAADRQRNPEPCVLVIFGATGDLTARKLLPALYNLAHEGHLPTGFAIVGFGRRPKSENEFRAELRTAVAKHARFQPINPAVWDALATGIFYQHGDYTNPADFQRLAQRLRQLDRERGTGGRCLFYLATPPAQFVEITQSLAAVGLNDPDKWLIVEKPFGRNLATARELNRLLTRAFTERQIFRIDHYLGKETVQNILVLRFANEIFEHLWNQKYVDHVQITVAETLGVEARGSYYDQAGALRDMVQNHMMQLLALIAMEPPITLEAEVIRDEKVKLLRAIRPIRAADAAHCTARGQYAAGAVQGQTVPAYLAEPGVNPKSRTETFAAIRLHIENWRWAGVPFYLRHGKRLPKRVAEIAIQFKAPPAVLFAAETNVPLATNTLAIRIQPDEGITIRMNAKVPGAALHIQPVKMEFRYGGSFGARAPDAYERLLHDALLRDATLFIRGDEAERCWEIFDELLATWEDPATPAPEPYEAGTWGPPAADALIRAMGHQWRRP
ncbi:MAG: glucose-6-phosphate dehydrogenase [Verrucomicrobiae bacterium]|nr:glucose-6-phosphate dehydrogenase [Verrucomicrobiae bacterium]